jgi:hypothetical protein
MRAGGGGGSRSGGGVGEANEGEAMRGKRIGGVPDVFTPVMDLGKHLKVKKIKKWRGGVRQRACGYSSCTTSFTTSFTTSV